MSAVFSIRIRRSQPANMSKPFVLVLLIPVFLAALVCSGFGQAAVPRFEPSDCAIPTPKDEKVVCGYVVVPENRSKKNGKTIRLPIIIQKSDNANPKADPVLRTLGGPGASSLKIVNGRRSSPWLKDRDVIIFEQRGTKFAQPSLACPEVDEATSSNARQHLDRSTAKTNEIKAAKTCFERLSKSGIDLNAYNSSESAADIEDVRKVLKLEKINLYGVSYSARLMLDVMRYYPDGIRSVVLESTLPPEVDYDEVGVDGIVRTLNELFAACKNDSECARAYPDLERKFYAIVAKLNAEPISVSTKDPKSGSTINISLNGDDFATWIVDYLFSNEPAATVYAPSEIEKAYAGNYTPPFKRYAGDKLGNSSFSMGMRYSFWCSEETPFEKTKIIKDQSTKYAGLKGYEVMALPDICGVWKVKRAKPVANKPVTSDIPTLILGAQYDAYTDPQWGRNVGKRLKKSFFVEIPWAGHGPGFSVPCVRDMIAEFFNDPPKTPNDACVEQTRKAFKFITKP